MFSFACHDNDISEISYKSHIAGRDIFVVSDPLNILQQIEIAVCISGYPLIGIPRLMIDINIQFIESLDKLTIY